MRECRFSGQYVRVLHVDARRMVHAKLAKGQVEDVQHSVPFGRCHSALRFRCGGRYILDRCAAVVLILLTVALTSVGWGGVRLDSHF